MKKIALISALLFFGVYLWVHIIAGDKESSDMVYPSMSAPAVSGIEISGQWNDTEKNPVVYQSAYSSDLTNDISPAWVIVASFTDPEQAHRAQEIFATKYQADIIILPPSADGYYRLSYGSYQSTHEAQAALVQLKESGFRNAWLLAN